MPFGIVGKADDVMDEVGIVLVPDALEVPMGGLSIRANQAGYERRKAFVAGIEQPIGLVHRHRPYS